MSAKFLRRHAVYFFAIVILTLFVTREIWTTGSVPNTHDGIYHTVRMAELGEMFSRGGQFPVRWAANLDDHYGLPLFNFVYPLPYYLGLPAIVLGISPFWTVKTVTIFAYLLGGLGMYLLLARKNRLLAFTGSVLYITAPYQLLNIFVRGALGETLAIAFMPWVLMSGLDLANHKLKWYHPLPLSLLFLSHNFLSFIFLPFYFILTVKPKSFRKILSSAFISLGLASWYLIPGIFESPLIHSVAHIDFTFQFQDHFVYFRQLLWSNWGYGLSSPGLTDGISFQLGLALIIALVVSLFFNPKKSLKLYLLLGLTLFLMLPASLYLWNIFPFLKSIQFPWRLLFLPAILIPLIISNNLRNKSSRLISLVSLVLVLISLFFAVIYSHPRYPMNETQYMDEWYANRYGTTTSSPWELRPKWVQEPRSDEYLHTNYFPNWYFSDPSGHMFLTKPSETGQILPDMTNAASLVFRQTPIEKVSNIISILAILLILKLALL